MNNTNTNTVKFRKKFFKLKLRYLNHKITKIYFVVETDNEVLIEHAHLTQNQKSWNYNFSFSIKYILDHGVMHSTSSIGTGN